MEVVNHLYGGSSYLVKLPVAQTFSNAGVAALVGTEAEAGVDLCTTTGAADFIGITSDTATYTTAQQSDNSDPVGLVRVDIRPDQVIEARLSGGATSGTTLATRAATAASTAGLTVTTGDDWSSADYDDGVVWGYDGANKGIVRKITSRGTTSFTVTVAFPYDVAVGDRFLYAGFFPFDDQGDTVTLTTELTEVRADVATGSGATLTPIRLIAGTIGTQGLTRSKVHLVAQDPWLGQVT